MTLRHQVSKKHTLMIGVIALTLAQALACTNVSLRCTSADCQPTYAAPLDNTMALTGEACTASPDSVGYPYKILFIVDVSGSTVTSDPTNNRGPAVAAVLNQYANNPEVSFAIISFDTQPNLLETTFTRDLNILLPIVPMLDLNLGQTNYLDTLARVKDIITADANQLDQVQRSRTRYDVQWLSDGVPQPCVDVSAILTAEQPVLDLTKSLAVFDIKLSTVFLTGAAGGSGCQNTPDQIMQPMATEGRGTYQALTGPNLKFNIDFETILQPFSKELFYVVNESRVVKNGKLLADSDRDGVSDEDETATGTDPTIPNTNPSGCSDRINFLQSANPNLCNSTCTLAAQNNNNVLVDTDADELKDCEELAMGTTRTKADSDGDNFIDMLEMRFGTNAADPTTMTVDTDVDGTTDGAEILTGTDPLTAEPDRSLAYTYAPLVAVTGGNVTTGENCFNFAVHNVQLIQTVATPANLEGDNVVCAYIEQRPSNTSSGDTEPTVSRACVTTNYKVIDNASVKSPASGSVVFSPSDFKPYICGSVACQ